MGTPCLNKKVTFCMRAKETFPIKIPAYPSGFSSYPNVFIDY